ncbi:MAG: DUF4445 domain-containing protein [Proteobacteria bacterium]|nr:DUF4445 domain-containing protein [Pseudomonadota bacterium]
MTKTTEATVVFTPSGKRGSFAQGTSVLDAARTLGVDLDSVCGGRGICGRCQIIVSSGDFAKFGITSRGDHLSPFGPAEKQYAEKRGLEEGRRLGCHSKILGDLVIDVPEESQVHRQVVRKRAEARAIEIDPLVRLYYIEVREPDMHDPTGDLERLKEALRDQWDVEVGAADLHALQSLQPALRKGDWTATAAVRGDGALIHVWPGFHDRAFGLAIDVGTTTVAAHLTDLASGEVTASVGAMNPQIRFGEDLMSRVSYIMMHPGGEVELIAEIRTAIDKLATEAAREAGIDADDILEITIVGNPVMHHLVLGINPVELGGAPFALAADGAQLVTARSLDIHAVNQGARVYTLPCVAGHVGADAAAVVLSEAPYQRDEMALIVDVGTNAEIVLGNRHRLMACSSPTGPAFEGAQITAGQRAAPGAIERVRIDPETLEPRFSVVGSKAWSDEDKFAKVAARTGVTGICGSGIIEVIAEMFLAGLLTTDGIIDGTLAGRTDRLVQQGRTWSYVLHRGEPEIVVTQTDIRAIQLAKAALYAGARLLMDRMEIETVDRVVLAGAFGTHIDPKYAMVLGMIPDCPLEHVQSAGNAAGTGARIALLNAGARAEIERVVRDIEKVETAVEPRFQEHFVEAMALPHKTAAYPNLATVVTLPEPQTAGPASDSGGRPRRRRRG